LTQAGLTLVSSAEGEDLGNSANSGAAAAGLGDETRIAHPEREHQAFDVEALGGQHPSI
jgi:hypothetical protein